jgi:hypothetical protein
MPAATFTANQTARLVATRTGRPCNAKQVRQWAREHMQRFMDDAYTSHAYSSAERDRIVTALVARRKANATGTNGRAASASRGRAGTTKATRKATKATKSTPKATPGIQTAPAAPVVTKVDPS